MPSARSIRLPLAAACAGSLLLAACGSSGSSSPTTTAPASMGGDGAAATVKIADFKYGPAEVTVKTGGRVTFANSDSASHTATADRGGGFDTGSLAKGASKGVVFAKAGTYAYHCAFHPFMHGTVTVR